MARVLRRATLVAAVVTAGAAVFTTIQNTTQLRGARAQLAQSRDYAAIANTVAAQQRLLRGAARSGATTLAFERLTPTANGLFAHLQGHSGGSQRKEALALAARYRAASEAAVSLLLGLPHNPPLDARAALGKVRARAAELQSIRRDAVAAHVGSPTTASRAATVLTAAAALLVLASLLLLGLRNRRQREAELARLRSDAHTDSLTGLGNHRSFHHDLTAAMQARSTRGSTFALMAVDLDGLKRINDAQGHQAGDAYLRQASECLREAARGEGTVYRTGGDEFTLLLPDRRGWHALAVARSIDQLTRAAFGRRAVSIGITESTSTEARHVLIQQADTALYDAKKGDVAAVVFYPAQLKSIAGRSASPSHQETLAAALARAVDAKDAGTSSHSETVAELSVAIGERMGIRGERLERLRRAGLLHDVGKIGVPDAILKKPQHLDAREQAEMKAHVTIGHAILKAAEMPTEAEWVLHHHERCDGAGYPSGLREIQIPIESRILAVADAFEAMTGVRHYQKFVSIAEALAELERNAGSQFDRRCVRALTEIMRHTAADDGPTPPDTDDDLARSAAVA